MTVKIHHTVNIHHEEWHIETPDGFEIYGVTNSGKVRHIPSIMCKMLLQFDGHLQSSQAI